MLWKLFVACAAILALGLAVRVVVGRELATRMIRVHGPGSRTPAARGLAFEEVAIPVGARTLRSFYVPAEGPGLLIFHGNGEAISGWVDTLKLLHDQGLAAMVFDYSGFGSSTGEPSPEAFREDGLAAWRAFRARLPAGRHACAYGLSLGSGVLLDLAPQLEPPPDCLAVSGAFLSARAAAVQAFGVPRAFWFALPDLYDSEENVARWKGPLLVEHGTRDALFPVAWAQRLAAAHPGAQLAIIEGMGHGDPVAHPSASAWDPVVRFVRAAR